MRILLPATTYRSAGVRLAPRPESLRGKTVGFLDGWGQLHADGSIRMYPLMRELQALLEERYAIGRTIWLKKANFAQRAPQAQIAELSGAADVVINGEAA